MNWCFEWMLVRFRSLAAASQEQKSPRESRAADELESVES
jgi:hypothetical protein